MSRISLAERPCSSDSLRTRELLSGMIIPSVDPEDGFFVGFGVAVGSGIGVAVGSGIGVAVGTGVAVGSGVGVGEGVGVSSVAVIAVGTGDGVGVAVGSGDGVGVGVSSGIDVIFGVIVVSSALPAFSSLSLVQKSESFAFLIAGTTKGAATQ